MSDGNEDKIERRGEKEREETRKLCEKRQDETEHENNNEIDDKMR